MKTIITTLLLITAINAVAATNDLDIKKYRTEYRILVTKWEKEKDALKRQSLKLEIEKLKAANTNLFHRK